MNKIVEEIRKAGVFYIATTDADGQPRVRPFGAVAEFEGKVYAIREKYSKEEVLLIQKW